MPGYAIHTDPKTAVVYQGATDAPLQLAVDAADPDAVQIADSGTLIVRTGTETHVFARGIWTRVVIR